MGLSCKDRHSTSSYQSYGSGSRSQSTGSNVESRRSHGKKIDAVRYQAEEDLGTALEVLKKINDIMKKNKKSFSIDIWGNFSNSTYCDDLENLCSKSRRIVLFVTKSFEQNLKTKSGVEYLYMNRKYDDYKFTCIKCGYGSGEKPRLKIWRNLPDFIEYENSKYFEQAIQGIFGISRERCSTDRKNSNARASHKRTKELLRQPPGGRTANKGTLLGNNMNECNPQNCEKGRDPALLTADTNCSVSECAQTGCLHCLNERNLPKGGDSSSGILVVHFRKDSYISKSDQADLKTNKVNDRKIECELETAITSQETGEALDKLLLRTCSESRIILSECEDVVVDGNTEPHSSLVDLQHSASSRSVHQDPVGTSETNSSLDVVVDSDNDQLSPPLDFYPSAISQTAQPDPIETSQGSSSHKVIRMDKNEQIFPLVDFHLSATSMTVQPDTTDSNEDSSSLEGVTDDVNVQIF